MFARWRVHWPIAVILCAAAALLFTNLGRGYLWEDEGDTAVLARSILKYGVPTAWDGVTLSAPDLGARLNDDFVMVSHPWLQYYVTAGSFALLGKSTFAARAPFVLFGLGTILLVYVIAFERTGDRRIAIVAALLLVMSAQFLLYSRQSRNYTLNAFLTCVLVWLFYRLRSWRDSVRFAAAGVLLFHAHPIGLVPIGVLGLLAAVHRPFAPRRPWFWRAMPIVLPLTVPWFLLAEGGYGENTNVLEGPAQFAARLGQFGIECASVAPLVGVLALAAIAWRQRVADAPPVPRARGARRARPRRWPILPPEQRSLALVIGAMIAGYAVAMAAIESRDRIWTVGLRYTPAILPFSMILAAMLIARVGRSNRKAWAALLVVFTCTKLDRITPLAAWADPAPLRPADAPVAFHAPPRLPDRLLRTGLVAYVKSLAVPNRGTTARICEFLETHAAPGDIVVTNYEWEPVYFHTELPQGMKIIPTYPIYQTALRRGLPVYVFGVTGARWIVWRPAWGPYQGVDIPRALEALRAAGVPFRRVATIPETLWENRENVHFRRYAGNTYLYPWFDDLPDAQIFRVDQPAGAGRAPAGG